MCENQFITLNQERRKDINSIIHSNRFDFFEDDKVYVFSQKGQEEVNIIQLLDYAKMEIVAKIEFGICIPINTIATTSKIAVEIFPHHEAPWTFAPFSYK